MGTADNDGLFSDDDMRRTFEITYEFLGDSGVQCSLDKQYLLDVLGYMSDALKAHRSCEGLWKAYVMLDVLIDRWEECDEINKEQED